MRTRFSRALTALFLLAGLTACANLPQSPATGGATFNAAETLDSSRFVGVFIPVQSAQVDRLIGPYDASGRLIRHLDASFVEARRKVRAGESGFSGATGTVTLSVRVGTNVILSREVTLGEHGMAWIELPAGTRVSNNAALCVETSFRLVQHTAPALELPPGRSMECTATGWLSRYFRSDRHPDTGEIGRGRRSGDRANVFAVRRAG